MTTKEIIILLFLADDSASNTETWQETVIENEIRRRYGITNESSEVETELAIAKMEPEIDTLFNEYWAKFVKEVITNEKD